jgi:hypothetical protein
MPGINNFYNCEPAPYETMMACFAVVLGSSSLELFDAKTQNTQKEKVPVCSAII